MPHNGRNRVTINDDLTPSDSTGCCITCCGDGDGGGGSGSASGGAYVESSTALTALDDSGNAPTAAGGDAQHLQKLQPPPNCCVRWYRACCGCSALSRCSLHWERISDVRMFTHSRFLTPKQLLAMRVVFVLWQLPACVTLGVYDWGPNSEGLVVAVTLSYLSYCSLVLYFMAISLFGLLNPKLTQTVSIGLADDPTSAAAVTAHREMKIDWKLKVLWVVFQILTADALVVTSVYWSVLYHPGKGLTWQDAHMHTLNSIMLLAELAMNSLPVVPAHALFLVLFGVVYLVWSLCVHFVSSQHGWIYPFLDYTKHWWSAFQYPIVLLYAVFMFGVVYALYRLRERIARTPPENVDRFDMLAQPVRTARLFGAYGYMCVHRCVVCCCCVVLL